MMGKNVDDHGEHEVREHKIGGVGGGPREEKKKRGGKSFVDRKK